MAGDAAAAAAVVAKAARGVRHLVGLQVISRALSFLLNVAVVRRVDTTVAGAHGVQLQLLLSLSLLLSREAARRTSARVPTSDPQRAANIAWTSVPLGATVVPAVCAAMVRWAPAHGVAGFGAAVWVFGAAAFAELLAEPAFCAALHAQRYGLRLGVETAAAIVRCVASFALVVAGNRLPWDPLVSLAIGQLFFALVLLFGYSLFAAPLRPRRTASGGFVGSALLRLALTFQWQTVQKLVLTEGEKFVLVFGESLVSQGVYAVVNNLGSLVVRFLFQPVEEVCFTAFGKLNAMGDHRAARRVLVSVVRFMQLVGLCFVCFGPAYSRVLIELLYTSKYSQTNAPSVLAWYCLYIFVVAVNGVTEAFVHSTAPERVLQRFNMLLVVFSVVFVFSASALVRVASLGTVGLVLANCINMVMRIFSSCQYISRWAAEHDRTAPSFSLWKCLPSAPVLSVLAASLALTLASERTNGLLVHISLGVVCFSTFAATVFWKERTLLSDLKALWRGKV